MDKVVVVCNLTLDGVMQAPGLPDEDLRGGFQHGGWAAPYSHDAMGLVMGEQSGETAALLLGRRTYEGSAGFWPKQNLVILGSGELIRSIPHLIDEYKLLIHPLVLGTGQRLFPTNGRRLDLTLTDATPTTTGVVITTYHSAKPGQP